MCAVLQLPHACHDRWFDERRADDDFCAVHCKTAGDLGVDTFVADADPKVADLGSGYGEDGIHLVPLSLLLDPLVPVVVRVRVAEHAALIGVTGCLVALVDDLAIWTDDKGNVEVAIRKVVIGDHVKLSCDECIELLRLSSKLVSLGTRDRHRELFFLGPIARGVRDHSLNCHLRNDDQADGESFPAANHDGGLHEATDTPHVLEGIASSFHLKGSWRQRHHRIWIDHSLTKPFPERRAECLRSHRHPVNAVKGRHPSSGQ